MRLAVFLAMFIATSCPAATYYVRNGGNDNSSGRSHSNAWATLTKVNNFSFAAGDVVLFQEGGRWQGRIGVDWAGTSSSHATVGAYYISNGTAVRGVRGARPIIDGAGQYPTGGIYDALVMVNTRDRVRIENLDVRNSLGRGVGFRRSHYGEVINVVVDGVYVDGIHFLDSDRGLVLRSTVRHAGRVFPEDGNLHPWAAAITFVNSDAGRVAESTVAESWGEGINANHGSNGTVIERNRIFAVRAVGIYADAAPNTTIRRNIILGTSNSTYWRSGSLVGPGIAVNNEAYHYEGSAPLALSVQSVNVRIYGNLVAGAGSGIALWAALPETSHNNLLIMNNTLIDNGRQISGLNRRAPGGRLVNNVLLSLTSGSLDVDGATLSGITARNNYFSRGNPGGGLSHSGNRYSGIALGRMSGWRSISSVNAVNWADFASAAGSTTVGTGNQEPLSLVDSLTDCNLDYNRQPFLVPMDMGAVRYSQVAYRVPQSPAGVYANP